ncbi:MAG: hypothetical protein NT062_06005, partial [Proteobacteria bacterium]|nr:hypothetical protein [Pseudomonadota bacterium]
MIAHALQIDLGAVVATVAERDREEGRQRHPLRRREDPRSVDGGCGQVDLGGDDVLERAAVRGVDQCVDRPVRIGGIEPAIVDATVGQDRVDHDVPAAVERT